ncbi:MAG TPA: MarR family transcriptional regulator [Acidimicrobiales bacterium]|nr:MarR family transcriptional regulator [Acidimicrobiales bacterium]
MATTEQQLGERELAEGLMEAISSIRRAARRHVGPVEELSALTGAQRELAIVVRRRPGISVAEAAAELALAPNTVSTLVRQLGEAGVLRRSADPDDRRVARLSLAPGVAQGMEEWLSRRSAALAAAVRRLSAGDRLLLCAALRPLERVAGALLEDGGGR